MRFLATTVAIALFACGCVRAGFGIAGDGDQRVGDGLLTDADGAADGSRGERDGSAGERDGSADDLGDAEPPWRFCGPGGWCWTNPVPVADILRGAWVDPADGVLHAVGGPGIYFRHDATGGWQGDYAPGDARLAAIWGFGETLVMVGESGTIVRREGTTWVPQVSGTTNALRAVSGRSASEIYAAGIFTVLEYDGSSWQEITPPPTSVLYQGVWTEPGADAWVVGMGGHVFCRSPADTAWDAVDTLTEDLVAVWGAGATVFTVGDGGFVARCTRQGGCEDLQSGLSGVFWDVWGRSATEVYLAGNFGAAARYDGTAFADVPFDMAVSALVGDADVLYAVGQGALRYEGSVATRLDSGREIDLQAVWGAGTSWFGAGGDRIWRDDGAGWQLALTEAGAEYGGLWGTGSLIFAVGNGVATRFDGSGWTHDSPPPAVFYRDVWGASATSVFAVGFGGMVRFDGSSWTDQTPAGPFVMLEGVWGVGPTEVYAVGTDLSFRYDGTEWLDWTAPAGSHRAIWGSGGSDIFVVGFSEVQHYDGSGWQRTVTGALVGVFGAGPDDVIAVGWSGEAIRYDGTSWESIAAGTEYDLHDVGYSAGKWRIVGLSGATLEWP